MVNMFSKMSRKLTALKSVKAKLAPKQKSVLTTALALVILAAPEIALAQYGGAGGGFFCYIAQYFKQIVGTAALVAIGMWALEHIFGVSKLHDIVIKVGIAAAMVIAGASIVTNSGLTTSCVL